MPWPLTRPTSDAHYLLYCRAYAAASALRLTLPDAMQENWMAPALLHWLGVGLLAFNGCFAGWLACALGATLPIFFLEDQLSQSTYLAFCAVAALVSFYGSRKRLAGGLQAAVRWMTVGVYALAALHKLNRDYFDPAVSCANEGLRVLAERSPDVLPDGIIASFDSGAWPLIHLGVELGIAWMLWWRPRFGVALAALMHVPLTIIFAPGFAFTMMSGWVCFFTYAELRHLSRVFRARWAHILVLGGIPAAFSQAVLFPGRWSSDPDWCVKEVVMWLVATGLCFVAASRTTESPAPRRWPSSASGVVVGAFIANGLTPYLGAQFHHTAAMLSNLRIDAGCHNSLVFPETLRGAHDPYVRLDTIDFADHRADPPTREAITERLWDLRALYEARTAWCRVHEEPLPAHGTFRGRTFTTGDLCSDWPLPEPSLSGFRRFQVNLKRACPQRCLH
jgi:hypothetical protein